MNRGDWWAAGAVSTCCRTATTLGHLNARLVVLILHCGRAWRRGVLGASTPLATQPLRDVPPIVLAGMLYLGSGIGLTLIRLIRDRGWRTPSVTKNEWLRPLLAIGLGGVLAPMARMLTLTHTQKHLPPCCC